MKRVIIGALLSVGLFGFSLNQNSTQVRNDGYVIQGKVLKAYTASGFGPRGFKWLFMDVKTKKAIIKIGIAPTFRISNLPINEGDIVKVKGFTPPYWPRGVIKALDIYDVTQKKDYQIMGYGPCWRNYNKN